MLVNMLIDTLGITLVNTHGALKLFEAVHKPKEQMEGPCAFWTRSLTGVFN